MREERPGDKHPRSVSRGAELHRLRVLTTRWGHRRHGLGGPYQRANNSVVGTGGRAITVSPTPVTRPRSR